MKLLILNQLGTPQSPTPKDVGIYLNEFLMDPNIISVPYWVRLFLVKVIIVPRRRYASAEKYQKVWTEKGSPLALNTFALEEVVRSHLPSDWRVVTSMRYGQPSLKSVFEKHNLNDYDEVHFLPLYPQFAQATVGSAVEQLYQILAEMNFKDMSKIKVFPPFYDQSWYIRAQAELIKSRLKPEDHLLFSYHGIPMSQEKKSKISYYQHCLKTSEFLADYLKLSPDRYSVSFQSRVGLAKWLEPSTEAQAEELAKKGIKSLKVACPSFVADCLETIEEIGMELKETYLHSGGESFELIPCLNSDTHFAEGISQSICS